LERATSLKLSSKKMKHFFKRFLDFEKKFGTEESVEHVKAKAKEYVASATQ
jgi:rRNA biogenesis protein RRP5